MTSGPTEDTVPTEEYSALEHLTGPVSQQQEYQGHVKNFFQPILERKGVECIQKPNSFLALMKA